MNPRGRYLHSVLPALPEVPSREEASDGVSGQMVDPALLSQLGHDGVDPREAGTPVRPLGQRLRVLVPRNLKCSKMVRVKD